MAISVHRTSGGLKSIKYCNSPQTTSHDIPLPLTSIPPDQTFEDNCGSSSRIDVTKAERKPPAEKKRRYERVIFTSEIERNNTEPMDYEKKTIFRFNFQGESVRERERVSKIEINSILKFCSFAIYDFPNILPIAYKY